MTIDDKIQSSLKFLGLIYNYSPLVYAVIGQDYKIQFVSKQVSNLLGYNQEEITGTIFDQYLMHSIEKTQCIVRKAIQNQKIQEVILKQYKKNKQIVYIKHVAVPIIENNKFKHLMLMSADATETIILQEKIDKRILDIITTLSKLIHMHSEYTATHSTNVSILANELAKRMQLLPEEQKDLYIAATLQDIGNIAIDEKILNKPTKLTEEEFKRVKEHPILGEHMLEHIEDFTNIRKIIRHHHESYDGSGYPDGLKHQEIPLESRIISVVDTFEAMNANRPHRPALAYEEIIAELKKMSGKRLDPMIVEIFIDYLHEANFKEIIDQASQIANNKSLQRKVCEACGNFYIFIEESGNKTKNKICYDCLKENTLEA